MKSFKKIGVIDFGGQYAHLIASRIRRLGAYSEILSNEEPLSRYMEFSGIILSGGPASVYEPKSPQIDSALLTSSLPILGICYGHQLLMQVLGGKVEPSNSKEYGKAKLELLSNQNPILRNLDSNRTVWMSHGDEVSLLPSGFQVLGSSPDCKYAFVANETKKIFGIQFHPEVTHSDQGEILLGNFIRICQAEQSWDIKTFQDEKIQSLQRQIPPNKKVFFLVSGGVDSLVAYVLVAKALGKDRIKGLLIDTGFMRENEVSDLKLELVKQEIDLTIWDARNSFYEALKNQSEPEAKRHIVGELFLKEQAKAVASLGLDPRNWLLGQGTIYPDTIESGGTKHSHKIKTHHNRVPAIEEMIKQGLIVEPISDLYKDEVRELGTNLGIPSHLVSRHPFPGPGLVVRMISSAESKMEDSLDKIQVWFKKENPSLDFGILPFKSVGVQGDQRSYAHCLAISNHLESWEDREELSRTITNKWKEINRVVVLLGESAFPKEFLYQKIELNEEYANRLRKADDLVTKILKEENILKEIWQMPVVLVPIGNEKGSASIVLRPVLSSEAMTASIYRMPNLILKRLASSLKALPGIDYVFFDLTNKPPGTIEWE